MTVRDSFRKISKGGGGGAKAHQKTFWGGGDTRMDSIPF